MEYDCIRAMAASLSPPRLLPSGDRAIAVEFAKNIDDAANQRVLTLDRALAAAKVDGVTETVPTYRSLLVHYDPVQIDFDALGEKAAGAGREACAGRGKVAALARPRRLWRRERHRPRGRRQEPEPDARRGRGTAFRRRLPRCHDRLHAGLVVSVGGSTSRCICRDGSVRGCSPRPERSRSAACRPASNAWPRRAAGICSDERRSDVSAASRSRVPDRARRSRDLFPVDAKTFAEQERAAEAGEIIAELVPA